VVDQRTEKSFFTESTRSSIPQIYNPFEDWEHKKFLDLPSVTPHPPFLAKKKQINIKNRKKSKKSSRRRLHEKIM